MEPGVPQAARARTGVCIVQTPAYKPYGDFTLDNFESTTESGIILDRRQIITGAAALGLSSTFGAMPAMAQGTPKKVARCVWVWKADPPRTIWIR